MAKKKGDSQKDEEKQTEPQVEEMILNYMRQVNRPYSANDIQLNLHITLSKAKVVKILTKLTDEGHFLRKTYNKSIIYCIKQDLNAKIATPEDIKQLDDSIAELTAAHNKIESHNNNLEKELARLKSIPTVDELKSKISKLQALNQDLQEKLSKLEGGEVTVSPEKRKRVNEEYIASKESWRKKRAKFREIYMTIAENYPGDKETLNSELGIEEDPVPFEKAFIPD